MFSRFLYFSIQMLKILLPSASLLVFLTTILPIFGVGEYHVVKGRRFCLLDTITGTDETLTFIVGDFKRFGTTDQIWLHVP